MVRSTDDMWLGAYLEKLIRHCGHGIRKGLRRKGADKGDAEEFFQLALCLLVMELGKSDFKIDGVAGEELVRKHMVNKKVCGWLFSTARNKWINELIRRKKELLTLESPSTFNVAAAAACIEKLLALLHDECRKILEWRFLDDRPLEDLAEELGIRKLESVKKRIDDCLKLARRLIENIDCDFD